jgi:predicted MFS family arabinose efflux permease
VNRTTRQTAGLAATLTVGMSVSTFLAFAFGALAPLITRDLEISRAAYGALITAMFAVGSLGSPLAGRAVDALGGRRVLNGLFVVAAGALLAAAAAPNYPLLLVAAALQGLSLAAGNPATNKLVAVHAPAARQGVIMGAKQSGVQIGAFLAGLLLPSGAVAIGWRGVTAAAVLLPVAGLVLSRMHIPGEETPAVRAADPEPAVGVWRRVGRLSAYAFAMGLSVAVVAAYLPLYAHERLGFSVTGGGFVASLVGLVGVAARVAWGHRADSSGRLREMLMLIAAGSIVSHAFVWGAEAYAPLVWIGAVGTGATAGSWNAVGMLVVVREAGAAAAGRASGPVLLAFYGGYVVSPIAFGHSLDVTGAYDVGWAGVMLCYMAAFAVSLGSGARVTRRAGRLPS